MTGCSRKVWGLGIPLVHEIRSRRKSDGSPRDPRNWWERSSGLQAGLEREQATPRKWELAQGVQGVRQ